MIQLTGVSKWYGEVIGLNNVTVSIGHGITGLLGPNGAGKSTLMGLATGKLRPSLGSIRVRGKNPWNNPSLLSRIGFCPEGDRFWKDLTGFRFVHFLARLSGLRGDSARRETEAAIDATGMTDHMHRAIQGYSKGMRQRIKIAQALVHRPALLILDEPFTGTDPVARHELSVLFRRLADDGVDILLSSHVLHEVEALTHCILMINYGRIVAHGVVGELRSGMQNKPQAIRVRVSRPRRLASSLAKLESVVGLHMTDPDALLVETTSPERVYESIQDAALADEMTTWEIAPADDSLEAVFGYFTERGG